MDIIRLVNMVKERQETNTVHDSGDNREIQVSYINKEIEQEYGH